MTSRVLGGTFISKALFENLNIQEVYIRMRATQKILVFTALFNSLIGCTPSSTNTTQSQSQTHSEGPPQVELTPPAKVTPVQSQERPSTAAVTAVDLLPESSSPEAKDVHQCLLRVCGPSRFNHSFHNPAAQAKPLSLAFRGLWKNVYSPMVRTAVMNRSYADKVLRAAIEKVTSSWVESSEAQNNLIGALQHFQFLTANTDLLLKEEDREVKVVWGGLSALGYSEKTWKAGRILLEEVLRPMADQKRFTKSPVDEVLQPRLELLYPRLSVDKALRKDAKELIKKLRRASGIVGPSALNLLGYGQTFARLVDKAATTGQLSHWEKQLYADRALRIDVASIALRPENDGVFKLNDAKIVFQDHVLYPTQEESWKYFWDSEYLNAWKPILTPYAEKIGESEMARASETCEADLAKSLGFGPEKKRRVSQIAETVRRQAKEVLQTDYAVDERFTSKALSAIDKIHFEYEDGLRERLQQIRFLMEESNEFSQAFVAKSDSAPETLGWDAIIEAFRRSTGGRLRSADLVEGMCSRLSPRASGHTSLENGLIRISAFDSINEEYTAGAIAHEIAHVVLIPLIERAPETFDSKFQHEFLCISRRDKSMHDAFGSFMESKPAREMMVERIANRIMSRYIKEGQTQSQFIHPKTLACRRLEYDDKGYSKANLELRRATSLRSSVALESLFSGMDTGTLPQECLPLKDRISKSGWGFTCGI